GNSVVDGIVHPLPSTGSPATADPRPAPHGRPPAVSRLRAGLAHAPNEPRRNSDTPRTPVAARDNPAPPSRRRRGSRSAASPREAPRRTDPTAPGATPIGSPAPQ